ncbi:MAG: hypothetical protein UW68_C0036G0007 [Candidatus Collierbacteria bacterium GW2011_GWB1_44_6]|uniref:Plasma membrane proteolipid n=2 Tax=Candidatus Collieribacteriota TaxID=1752725 RepID=A0A0G1JLQ8_9BACT|nr:MAG: hypothetical protein UV68_C0005G0007 [Candidatus Collierbacteria bacterium GW2011_GWC2_43_12]KKT72476.1 MAG: hypothetical protein UW68_C0036G0007 [Candidatus Collierbacteria bacterium GW2011_GWB1_44_6]KKT81222.1 MAG: hypothetical protein UW80_C0055G0008 [Microgenomates group bacterium GW2011_GWC1_44_9]
MASEKNININIDLSSFQKMLGDLGVRLSHLTGTDVGFVILAVIMPPLAVFIKVGFTFHFWINLVLTLLGWVPGQIHALWVVLFV